MVAFPLAVIFFFTSLLEQGQPQEMPVGVVDLDNTSTTRTLIRTLDAFQSCEVVAHYATPAEAREAIENNKIYGFLYIPEGTTEKLIASRQPKISFYYTMTTIMSGSLVYRDMKTVATLGSAALGMATMRAKGLTDKQIKTLMQPIAIDLHQIGNPTTDYNAYLTTVMVPGILMLFIFLITAYAIGTELKFNRGKQLVEMGEPHIWVSLIGKFLPHTGGVLRIVLLNVLMVLSSQGFGLFAFGLMPSLRMSMSVCSLWAVLSISMAGSAFPLIGMDGPLQAMAWLFPLRHYFMLYQIGVLNDYPILDAWFHIAALVAFILLPIMVAGKIKNAMLNYVYIP